MRIPTHFICLPSKLTELFIRCDELFKYLPNLDLCHDKLYVIYRCSDCRSKLLTVIYTSTLTTLLVIGLENKQ